MASTPVEFVTATGLTNLKLYLYAHGSDTCVNGAGDECSERISAKGIYTAIVTEALSGLHDAVILDSNGNLIATYHVDLADDTNTHRCGDWFYANLVQLADETTPVEQLISLVAHHEVFDGMTSLPKWLRALIRSDAADETALAEINDPDGDYDEVIHSLEGAHTQVNFEMLDVLQTDTLIAGVSIVEALRRIGAKASGKLAGAGDGDGTETIYDWEESVHTIVYTVDENGNYTAVHN